MALWLTSMRVVMGGESLIGQKTGIGQYTENLASQLLHTSEVEDLKFLAHGKIIPAKNLLDSAVSRKKKDSSLFDLVAKARGIASQYRAAVWCYEGIMPLIEWRSLRAYKSQDIFHSPNYLLPNFPGKRVVSILDLSTFKYPQFHAHARVWQINKHINKAVGQADHIITISDYVKNEIIEIFGIKKDKITTTYLAAGKQFRPMTDSIFSYRIAIPNLTYKSYFLCASTIEPRKNISRLLDAYQIYRGKEGSRALPLIMVGHPGWHSKALHRRIDSLKGANGVRYLGYVKQTQMPILFAGARALLFPSLYEGFGLPVLEAMQAGTAVLTSSNSAMSEVAQNAAALIDPLDEQAIADAICVLASDDSKVKKLEAAGIVRSSNFTWEKCAERTLSIYKKLQFEGM